MAKIMAEIQGTSVVNVLRCADREPETDALKNLEDCPACIGDTYSGGSFWRNGRKVVTPLEKMQEQYQALTAQLAAMDEEYQKGVNSL